MTKDDDQRHYAQWTKDIQNCSEKELKKELNLYHKDNIFSLLNKAISEQNVIVIDRILTHLNVPKHLSLKERICYYYLIVPEDIN